jgi:glutamine synthetase
MVRIPIGNEKSARVEVRSVGPDANPYITMYTLLRTGLEGPLVSDIRSQECFLPDNIYTAVENFQASEYVAGLLGEDVRDKFAELKLASADRCPRLLGTRIKRAEVQFHHEVTNQNLWSRF